MSWQAYRLVYQAKSPIHIGYRTLGYIQRTRYYIPGRALWGAFTANLTRAYASYDKYGDVGNDVHRELRFTYFYPALDPQKPLLPRFTTEGLKFVSAGGEVSCTEGEFERTFISAFGQTAVEPSSNTAEEASLHETEFISPCVQWKDQQRQVHFVGCVFLKDGAKIRDKDLEWDGGPCRLKEAVQDIFVGGERKYGFGRLRLQEESGTLTPGKDGELRLFGYTFDSTGHAVTIEMNEGSTIPAHLDIQGALNLKGDIEPVVGREWGEVTAGDGKKKAGAGQVVSKAQLCWVPGSVVTRETRHLVLGDYGILKVGTKHNGKR